MQIREQGARVELIGDLEGKFALFAKLVGSRIDFLHLILTLGSSLSHPPRSPPSSSVDLIPPSFAAMVKTHLEAWIRASGGSRPEKLIMWRDGVSEGQLGPVVESEVTQIKRACHSIDPSYSPKLTFIVCAKRCVLRTQARRA